MSAKLHYKRGPEEREIICSALLTIGRTPPNEVVVPHPKVSRNHAIIRMLRPGEHYLIDVGSTNGTFLNGKRVVVPTLLKDLDVIALEDCTLTYCAPPAREAAPAAAEEDDGQATVTMTSAGIQMEGITLFVCDIRNYTPISESMPPNELAALMARWFKLATKVIEACSGTIDKFIGDAILVRWATETETGGRRAVVRALKVAQGLNEVCAQVNAAAPRLPHPFRIGVGINTGRAVLGSIGGAGYREYTVIGDSVNMAFRFETESKRLGKDIVIGPDSYRFLPRPLWEGSLASVVVKGKSDPVDVWAITFGEADAVLARAAE